MEERKEPIQTNESATVSGAEVLQKPQKKGKAWIFVGMALLLTILVCFAWMYYANLFSLNVVLEGEQELLLEYGEHYEEPGVKAVIRVQRLGISEILLKNALIQTETDLQENTLGKYTITYLVDAYGWQASAQRTIRVVDSQCPTITLTESEKTILPGQIYEEEGFTAADNYDGDLTDQVRRTEEYGKIIYTVVDSSGNPACAEREIPYYDPLPPEVQLEGEAFVTIPCGTLYVEPGFTARDNADGDLTDAVAVDGEVVWYRPGTYEISYLVSDSYGNVTQKFRTVEVQGQPWPEEAYPGGKVIYLTFDDGPGPFTGQLLDVLNAYGVKATFFVTDSGYPGILRRIVQEGHSIGIHTMYHDYDSIYASEEAFFADLMGMQNVIYDATGVKTTLMRFPGGSSNLVSRYNEGIMTTLSQAVQDAGFQYFDWNVDSNDAGGARRSKTVAANVIGGVQNKGVSVVLQHDIHDFSVAAVEDILVWGLAHGYRFLPLKENSPGMHHTVLN